MKFIDISPGTALYTVSDVDVFVQSDKHAFARKGAVVWELEREKLMWVATHTYVDPFWK